MAHSHAQPLGRAAARPFQSDPPLLHPHSGLCHVGLSSWLVRWLTRQLKAKEQEAETASPLDSAPRMAVSLLPRPAVKAAPGQPSCRVRGKRQTSDGRRVQKRGPLMPHNCVFKEQEETTLCSAWRKELGPELQPRSESQRSLNPPIASVRGPVISTQHCVTVSPSDLHSHAA